MQQELQNYLLRNNYNSFDLKAILFDMDGVLYNSSPPTPNRGIKQWRSPPGSDHI